jgi:hypothetical protein
MTPTLTEDENWEGWRKGKLLLVSVGDRVVVSEDEDGIGVREYRVEIYFLEGLFLPKFLDVPYPIRFLLGLTFLELEAAIRGSYLQVERHRLAMFVATGIASLIPLVSCRFCHRIEGSGPMPVVSRSLQSY